MNRAIGAPVSDPARFKAAVTNAPDRRSALRFMEGELNSRLVNSPDMGRVRFAMPSKAEIISRLTNPGVIAVVRALRSEQVIPLSAALVEIGRAPV